MSSLDRADFGKSGPADQMTFKSGYKIPGVR